MRIIETFLLLTKRSYLNTCEFKLIITCGFSVVIRWQPQIEWPTDTLGWVIEITTEKASGVVSHCSIKNINTPNKFYKKLCETFDSHWPSFGGLHPLIIRNHFTLTLYTLSLHVVCDSNSRPERERQTRLRQVTSNKPVFGYSNWKEVSHLKSNGTLVSGPPLRR